MDVENRNAICESTAASCTLKRRFRLHGKIVRVLTQSSEIDTQDPDANVSEVFVGSKSHLSALSMHISELSMKINRLETSFPEKERSIKQMAQIEQLKRESEERRTELQFLVENTKDDDVAESESTDADTFTAFESTADFDVAVSGKVIIRLTVGCV